MHACRSLPSRLMCATPFCATPAAAQDLPPRKAGLWEIKMTTEGHNMPPNTSEHCIDAETDKLMSSMGDNVRQDMCSKRDVKKVGNTIVVDSRMQVRTDDDHLAGRRQRRLQQRL